MKGRGHPKVGRILNHLAAMRLALEDHRGTSSTLNRALTIFERTYGRDHPALVDTLDLHVALLRRQGRLEEAARMRKRSLAARAKAKHRD